MNFYNNKSEISTMNLIHDFSNSIRHNSRRIAMKFCKKSCLLLLNCTVDKRKDVQNAKKTDLWQETRELCNCLQVTEQSSIKKRKSFSWQKSLLQRTWSNCTTKTHLLNSSTSKSYPETEKIHRSK